LLTARQKHVAHLKRKLGISPLNELTTEMAQGLKTVKDTPALVCSIEKFENQLRYSLLVTTHRESHLKSLVR
jgi:hypothetical protein